MLRRLTQVVLGSVDVRALLQNENSADKEGKALGQVIKLIEEYGAAGFKIGMLVFVYGSLIALLGCAVRFLIHRRNKNKRVEQKDGTIWTIFVIVLGFAAIGIFLLAALFTQN